MKEAGAEYTKYRVEIACSIAEVYMQLKILEPVKQLLRKESAHSRDFPLIHARLLFLLAVFFFLYRFLKLSFISGIAAV